MMVLNPEERKPGGLLLATVSSAGTLGAQIGEMQACRLILPDLYAIFHPGSYGSVLEGIIHTRI
jgi:hypothetical protein